MEINRSTLEQALANYDETIGTLSEVAEYIFSTLGMRNLSAFVGEIFVRSMVKAGKGIFIRNPHQDGYPDLLVMTKEGKTLYRQLSDNLRDKQPFSNYKTGGIEVKATCGSVPTPKELKKKGLFKPDIGDQRIKLMRSYDWKAHHRLTNNMIGIVWDFIDRTPTIVGLFFSSDLAESDWGKIISPKEGGGRTTSVSIMGYAGIQKMYSGWISVIDDNEYVNFFNAFNESNLIVLD